MGRKEKVESAIREHLSDLIAREVKDPRVQAVGLLGVSKVECTPDLSLARVWISIYADDAVAEKALKGLTAAAGFLRGPLARRLNLARPPELRFARDVTAEMSIKLRGIVQDDAARARAAGRGEEPSAVAAAAEPAPEAAAADVESEPAA